MERFNVNSAFNTLLKNPNIAQFCAEAAARKNKKKELWNFIS